MSTQSKKQLFSPVSELKLFDHHALGSLVTKDGSNMPFIVWPDGRPCLLANLYMLALRDRSGRGGQSGLSRKGSKGGTMGDYAAKISQLIRYCFHHDIDFIELTDNGFSSFISSIRTEVLRPGSTYKRKSETTVLNVGRVCLDFLSHVGHFYGDNTFVSPTGRIRTTHKTATIKTRSGKIIKRDFVHHHSLSLSGGRPRTRDPITAQNIGRLRDAINRLGKTRHLQMRRHVMISLLEHTGARRSEIANILVSDVLAALAMEFPMLRLETLKRGVGVERTIPITKMLLNELKKYIDFPRKKLISKFRKSNDHGFLFVSDQNGSRLNADSITNEVFVLKKHAGIKEPICAHMFRHAFITNLFVLLIRRHELESVDDFRRALLDSKKFVAEVMQWTGHQSPDSVERYIHLAFEKVSNYHTTVSSVYMIKAIEVFDQSQEKLLNDLKAGMPVAEYATELEKLKKLRNEDLEIAKTRAR